MERLQAISEPRDSQSRLIGTKEMLRLHGVSKSTLNRHIAKGIIPAPASKPEGTTSILWFENEVKACLEARRVRPMPQQEPYDIDPLHEVQSRNAKQIPAPKKSSKNQSGVKSTRSKPYLVESGSSTQVPDSEILIHAEQIAGRTVYLESATGRLFDYIGQLPPLQADRASDVAVAVQPRAKKGMRK